MPRGVLNGLLLFFWGAASCNAIGGIHKGAPLGDRVPCESLSDCLPAASECRAAKDCVEEICVLEDEPYGARIAAQTPGDCVEIVCDGAGRTAVSPLPSDVDDGDPCTLDACDGLSPTHARKTELPCYTGPAETRDRGACAAGVQRCDDQGKPLGACEGQVLPGAETCALIFDEDCDGEANEEGSYCACAPGDAMDCYTGLPLRAGVGACALGTQTCDAAGTGFSACVGGDQAPAPESCDAGELDEDCDGVPNEEGAGCACGDGYLSEREECDDGGTSGAGDCSPTCSRKIAALGAGDAHTCAVLYDGRVKCWGFNLTGQLGLGDTAARGDGPNEMAESLPAADLSAPNATAVAAGANHTCALFDGGHVKCWGRNNAGQLGQGDTQSRGDAPNEMGSALPVVDLSVGATATAIAAASYRTCALLDDGRVKCWGDNVDGDLGQGDTQDRGDEPGEMGDNLPAVDLGVGEEATAIAAGGGHTCALLEGGRVKCWGSNGWGQLGQGDTLDRGDEPNEMGDNLPAVDLGASAAATAIAAGDRYTCALLHDRRVKCWGDNNVGQLGLGDALSRGDEPNEMGSLPAIDLGAGKTAAVITAGGGHVCALLNNGSLKCWGNGGYLGLGDDEDRGDGPDEMGDHLPVVKLYSGFF